MTHILGAATLIVPFYRNVAMLAEQVRTWNAYPHDLPIVVVDDGSPEPAEPIIRAHAGVDLLERLQLYRIAVDIPWNRGGARNLGATVADTEWIVHIDIDHVLPPDAARALLAAEVDPTCWYRFPRFRVGAADDTRRKDALPRDATFGAIKPHIDSYLCRRDLFWRVGGYDEDYSGCLGGGSPFLQQLERAAPLQHLPAPICLHVHTRDSVPDASDWSLDRDTSEYSRRRKLKEKRGDTKPKKPLRFQWARVL